MKEWITRGGAILLPNWAGSEPAGIKRIMISRD
jgi:hypothetical protein